MFIQHQCYACKALKIYAGVLNKPDLGTDGLHKPTRVPLLSSVTVSLLADDIMLLAGRSCRLCCHICASVSRC